MGIPDLCVWAIKIILEIDVNNSVDKYNAVSEKTITLLPEDTSKNRRRTDYKDKQNTYNIFGMCPATKRPQDGTNTRETTREITPLHFPN